MSVRRAFLEIMVATQVLTIKAANAAGDANVQ
jgi:hypothetical protein